MKKLTLAVIFLLLVLVAVASAFAQDAWHERAESSAVSYTIPVTRMIPECVDSPHKNISIKLEIHDKTIFSKTTSGYSQSPQAANDTGLLSNITPTGSIVLR